MSAEPPEDAKPKLNLVISLLEARMFSPSDGLVHNLTTRAVGITVKVKANMQFKKIFEVAEVCRDLSLLSRTSLILLAETIRKRSWCACLHIRPLTRCESQILTRLGTLRFVYDGERLSPTDTPAEVRFPLCHSFCIPDAYVLTMFSGRWKMEMSLTRIYNRHVFVFPLTVSSHALYDSLAAVFAHDLFDCC